jgi:signal transduction histidine kinase
MLVRTSWMRPLVVVTTAVYAVVLAWSLSYLPGRATIDKSPGWVGSPRAPQVVAAVDAKGPAAGKLQLGDRIVALDAETDFAGLFTPGMRLDDYAPGSRYVLTVERGGRQVPVALTVPARQDRSRLPFLGAYLLGSLGFVACALLMGWKRPEDGTAQLGWLACLLTAFFYIEFCFEVFPGWSTPVVAWAAGMVHPWHLFAVYCFIASFQALGQPSPKWSWFRWALVPLCVASWLEGFVFEGSPFMRTFGTAAPGWLLSGLGSMSAVRVVLIPLGIIAVMVRNYRACTSAADRRRIEILAGSIAGCLLIVALSTTFERMWADPGLWVLMLGNLAPVLIPLCFCYAVMAHQVLDIRLILRRRLQYLFARQVLRVLVLLPLLAIVVLALRHPNAPIRSMMNLTGLGLLVSIALCLEFRDKIQGALDRWFLREQIDRERLMRRLLVEIAAAESFAAVVALVSTRLKAIYAAEFVRIQERTERASADPGGDVAMALPFHGSNGKTVGWLALGPRLSDERYAPADQELLQLIASQVGLVREMLHVLAHATEVNDAVLEERARIARELHDTAEQGFAGISLYLAAAGRSMQASPEQAGEYLQAARELAKTSARETRESVRELRGAAAAGAGTPLEGRLRALAERFPARFAESSERTPEVVLDLPVGVCTLVSDEVGWHLARVAEEAVTNACKHAAATRIQVRLRSDGQRLELTVRDNGSGFDPAHATDDGFGLRGMRERMHHVQGTVAIASSPGSGTEVYALVPVALAS